MDSRKKKGLIGGVTILLAATLFIGGTMAWTDFTQNRTNRFRGSVNYDATLHDDFDGQNKDVYVENTGENPIYVRVRLDEYMQIGNINMLGQDVTQDGSVTSLDKDQWIPHKYPQDGDPTECTAYVPGADTDLDPDPATVVGNPIQFHKYYQWNMSGAKIWYDPGTPGVVSSVLDGYKMATDPSEKQDADGFALDMYGARIPIVDASEATGGTTPTLEASTPITMTQYIALAPIAEKVEAALSDPSITLDPAEQTLWDTGEALWTGVQNGCWILDEDGWAYWSQPLEPGKATNLLLDEVTLKGKEPTDDWYYAIDVKMQAVSLNETLTTWQISGDYTDNAAVLIGSWNEE